MKEVAEVALVVPSIRKESFERFIREWRPTGLFDRVDLFLIEDNPEPTFETPPEAQGRHYSWSNIDTWSWSWIIPRRSDTVRSFGYWRAWSLGYKYLMTLDDDCYPAKGYERLDVMHRQMLEGRSRWFNTLNSVTPRGVPYKNLGNLPVHVNHGIWQGVLDYDAPHQLVDPQAETYTHDNRIVPHGAYFPFCGMNWLAKREAIILMYHMLMGHQMVDGQLKKLPFDRWGDITCGLVMKKIVDHLSWAVSTGTPYIHHDRASDPFTNLRKEAAVLEINEWLWEAIDAIDLKGLSQATDCYAHTGEAVRKFGSSGRRAGQEHASYFDNLGRAMITWAELFV